MNSSANEPLKDLISQIKVTHKLKQSQVAERLEVHPSYLSDMIDILHKQPSKSTIYKGYGLKKGLLHSGPFFDLKKLKSNSRS